jgi:hypothetical protein
MSDHEDFRSRIDAYMLRTCKADGTSRNSFVWPTEGYVEAPDWDPRPVCGGGLHGLAWGEGQSGLLDWSDDARWQVVGYIAAESVVVTEGGGGKIKIPRGWVMPQDGTRFGATSEVIRLGARGAVHGATVSGGDRAAVSGGDWATVSGGDRATVSGGYGATVTGGDRAELCIRYWDGKRLRTAIGYVGENGIEPNVPYRCDDNGRLRRAEEGGANR